MYLFMHIQHQKEANRFQWNHTGCTNSGSPQPCSCRAAHCNSHGWKWQFGMLWHGTRRPWHQLARFYCPFANSKAENHNNGASLWGELTSEKPGVPLSNTTHFFNLPNGLEHCISMQHALLSTLQTFLQLWLPQLATADWGLKVLCWSKG